MNDEDPRGRPWREQVLHGLPNSGWVWFNKLGRSGQPERRQIRQMGDAGFNSVINLQAEHNDDVSGAGLRYLHLPLKDHHAPSLDPENAECLYPARFFQWVANPENTPCVVHCGKGSGRTGLFVALLRYQIDHWMFARIREEAISHRVPRWLAPWAIGWLDEAQKEYFRRYVRATGGDMG